MSVFIKKCMKTLVMKEIHEKAIDNLKNRFYGRQKGEANLCVHQQ